MEPDLLTAMRALADVARLRVAGRLADGPMTVEELATTLGLPAATVAHHLERLEAAGLVASMARSSARAFVLRANRLQDVARTLATEQSAADADRAEPLEIDGEDATAEESAVLRAFVRDGRLVSIPAQDRKRQVILRFLRGQLFAEDRVCSEREVNERLAGYHEDVAALRRYLVEAGLMTRAAGEYRRA